MNPLSYELNLELLQDFINLTTGLFSPLTGFMTSSQHHSVLQLMELPGGEVWTMPISLDVDGATFSKAGQADKLLLTHLGEVAGYIQVEDCFQIDPEETCFKVFKTNDSAHPGAAREMRRSPFRIGGRATLTNLAFLQGHLHPGRTLDHFARQGWKTVAGFQTRNPIHNAHEFQQRLALDHCDGLFVNPITGWKRAGDFSEAAVFAAYERMIQTHFPPDRVYLEGLRTPMRYAGPREAIFHALIRRNAGCTHFIIGRDHAGVGNYYRTYEAHELAHSLMKRKDLGVCLLLFKEPYYCLECDQVVNETTCPHGEQRKLEISGSAIRRLIAEGKHPDPRMMRSDIAETILAFGGEMFVKE
jgi:sulfate adenylyltransferase